MKIVFIAIMALAFSFAGNIKAAEQAKEPSASEVAKTPEATNADLFDFYAKCEEEAAQWMATHDPDKRDQIEGLRKAAKEYRQAAREARKPKATPDKPILILHPLVHC